MNYYYSDQGGEVEGPISTDELHQLVRQGVLSKEAIVCAEGTNDWLGIETLIAPPLTKPTGPPPSPMRTTLAQPAELRVTPNPRTGAEVSYYLERLRVNSCYGTLRLVINIMAVVSLVGVLGFFALLALGTAAVGSSESSSGVTGFGLFVGIGGMILGVVGVIAWRQASLLFIDLVDTQLERNSRRE